MYALIAPESPWTFGWGALEAIGTAAAAIAAIVIWRADVSRQRRANAAQVTGRVEWVGEAPNLTGSSRSRETVARIVVANDSEAPAYNVRVSRIDGQAQPLFYGLIRAGEREENTASGGMLKQGRVDDVNLIVEFTMHGFRWRTCCDGRARRNWGAA